MELPKKVENQVKVNPPKISIEKPKPGVKRLDVDALESHGLVYDYEPKNVDIFVNILEIERGGQ